MAKEPIADLRTRAGEMSDEDLELLHGQVNGQIETAREKLEQAHKRVESAQKALMGAEGDVVFFGLMIERLNLDRRIVEAEVETRPFVLKSC